MLPAMPQALPSRRSRPSPGPHASRRRGPTQAPAASAPTAGAAGDASALPVSDPGGEVVNEGVDEAVDHSTSESASGGVLSDASRAYQRLRQDIVRGALAPAGRLRISELARRLGVSAIPVREALNRLAREGFVSHAEQRGFTVAAASEADFRELTLARCWTYEAALRDSIAHGDAAWEESLLLVQHRLAKVPRHVEAPDGSRQLNPAYDEPHKRFHGALIAACRSGWMIRVCEDLFDHAVRYQHLARERDHSDRQGEHAEIVRLCLDRDADGAVAALRAHLRYTERTVIGG